VFPEGMGMDVDETNFLRHIRLVLVEVFSGEFFFDPQKSEVL